MFFINNFRFLNAFYLGNKYVFYICLLLTVYGVLGADVNDIRSVFKRQEFDDYHTCASNFEIHQDKIIRTEESKKMGAKYLNGKDVTSKEECLKFCCKTPNCNVFVLEEKVFNRLQGTCYLFECGTPENFKCKFTRHHNYSSAVLIISRPQIQLEDEIQYTQHERELTNLRTGENSTQPKNCDPRPKVGLGTAADESNFIEDVKETPKQVDEGIETTFKKTGKCSRFQFECHSSGECIAIYNACDGIPQCADHSDESIELGCPTNVPVSLKREENIRPTLEKHNDEIVFNRNLPENFVKPFNAPYKDKNPAENPVQVATSVNQNMIDCETYARPLKMNQWQPRFNQQSFNPVHNFNHQQNGMNIPYNYGEYANGETNPVTIYDGYPNAGNPANAENNFYQTNINSWHGKPNLTPDFDAKTFNIPKNKVNSEYYFKEKNTPPVNKIAELVPLSKAPVNVTTKTSNVDNSVPATSSNATANQVVKPTTTQNIKKSSVTDSTTVKIKKAGRDTVVETKIQENTNIDDNGHHHDDKQNSHRKLEKQLSAEIKDVQEKYLDADVVMGSYTQQTNGAYVSLTLGLCVTAILIFIVAYRLKGVRRRIRRGGKLPFAHDPDYLVNGMYL